MSAADVTALRAAAAKLRQQSRPLVPADSGVDICEPLADVLDKQATFTAEADAVAVAVANGYGDPEITPEHFPVEAGLIALAREIAGAA